MMAPCSNHPQVEASRSCAGCVRPFCEACLVEILATFLCERCRDLMLARLQEAPAAAPPPDKPYGAWEFRLFGAAAGAFLLGVAGFLGGIYGRLAFLRPVPARYELSRDSTGLLVALIAIPAAILGAWLGARLGRRLQPRSVMGDE